MINRNGARVSFEDSASQIFGDKSNSVRAAAAPVPAADIDIGLFVRIIFRIIAHEI